MRVKKGHECRCYSFSSGTANKLVEIIGIGNNFYHYDILDEEMIKVGAWCDCFTDDDLIPFERTWETLKVGDVVIDEDNDECTVLAVCGKAFLVSDYRSPSVMGGWFLLDYVKSRGWRIKGVNSKEKPVLELTLDEVAEKFGVDVKRLKIKKEK